MADIYVFGTMAADVVIRVHSMPTAGSHLRGEYLGWRPGGSSANIACALSSAGHTVQLVGPVGTDKVGKALLEAVHARGVRTEHTIPVPAAPRTLIFLDHAGERTILALRGPGKPNSYDVQDLPGLAEAEAVWVESFTTFPREIAEVASHAIVAVPPPDDPALSGPADLLVGAKSQFPTTWLQAPLQAARAAMGERLRHVVVTDGSRGAIAYGDAVPLSVPAQAAQQVDATGAGDAFAAGLLHCLLEGWKLPAAMELGTAWAAAAVEELQSIPPGIEALLGGGA
jgi:sugar/nucleoside kinase (ribokinase family)